MTASVLRYTIFCCMLLTACISEPEDLGITPTGNSTEAWSIGVDVFDYTSVTRDGSLVLAHYWQGSRRAVQLFDAASGEAVSWPQGMQPESGMFSDDLQFFAYSHNGAVKIVRWPSGDLVTEYGFQMWPGENITMSFAWKPSGDVVYVYVRGYNINGIFQLHNTSGAQPEKLIDAPMFQSYDDVPQFRHLKNANALQISESLVLDLRSLTFIQMPSGEERFFGWPASNGASWYRGSTKDIEKIDGNQQREYLLPLSTTYAANQFEAVYFAVDANERFAAVQVEHYVSDGYHELWVVDLQDGSHIFHVTIGDLYSNSVLYVEFDPTGERAIYATLNGWITKWTF